MSSLKKICEALGWPRLRRWDDFTKKVQNIERAAAAKPALESHPGGSEADESGGRLPPAASQPPAAPWVAVEVSQEVTKQRLARPPNDVIYPLFKWTPELDDNLDGLNIAVNERVRDYWEKVRINVGNSSWATSSDLHWLLPNVSQQHVFEAVARLPVERGEHWKGFAAQGRTMNCLIDGNDCFLPNPKASRTVNVGMPDFKLLGRTVIKAGPEKWRIDGECPATVETCMGNQTVEYCIEVDGAPSLDFLWKSSCWATTGSFYSQIINRYLRALTFEEVVEVAIRRAEQAEWALGKGPKPDWIDWIS